MADTNDKLAFLKELNAHSNENKKDKQSKKENKETTENKSTAVKQQAKLEKNELATVVPAIQDTPSQIRVSVENTPAVANIFAKAVEEKDVATQSETSAENLSKIVTNFELHVNDQKDKSKTSVSSKSKNNNQKPTTFADAVVKEDILLEVPRIDRKSEARVFTSDIRAGAKSPLKAQEMQLKHALKTQKEESNERVPSVTVTASPNHADVTVELKHLDVASNFLTDLIVDSTSKAIRKLTPRNSPVPSPRTLQSPGDNFKVLGPLLVLSAGEENVKPTKKGSKKTIHQNKDEKDYKNVASNFLSDLIVDSTSKAIRKLTPRNSPMPSPRPLRSPRDVIEAKSDVSKNTNVQKNQKKEIQKEELQILVGPLIPEESRSKSDPEMHHPTTTAITLTNNIMSSSVSSSEEALQKDILQDMGLYSNRNLSEISTRRELLNNMQVLSDVSMSQNTRSKSPNRVIREQRVASAGDNTFHPSSTIPDPQRPNIVNNICTTIRPAQSEILQSMTGFTQNSSTRSENKNFSSNNVSSKNIIPGVPSVQIHVSSRFDIDSRDTGPLVHNIASNSKNTKNNTASYSTGVRRAMRPTQSISSFSLQDRDRLGFDSMARFDETRKMSKKNIGASSNVPVMNSANSTWRNTSKNPYLNASSKTSKYGSGKNTTYSNISFLSTSTPSLYNNDRINNQKDRNYQQKSANLKVHDNNLFAGNYEQILEDLKAHSFDPKDSNISTILQYINISKNHFVFLNTLMDGRNAKFQQCGEFVSYFFINGFKFRLEGNNKENWRFDGEDEMGGDVGAGLRI